MGRYIPRMMHQRLARQRYTNFQPVGGRDKLRDGGFGAERVEQPGDIGVRRYDPTRSTRNGPCAPYSQEAVADREARLKAAFAKRIVARRFKDPSRIYGRLEYVIHRFWLFSCRPPAEPPVNQRVDGALIQACHHQIRTCGPQFGSIVKPGDTERRHAAGASRLDAGGRVLDYEAVWRRYVQFRGGEQENFRVWLALPQIAAADIGGEDFE